MNAHPSDSEPDRADTGLGNGSREVGGGRNGGSVDSSGVEQNPPPDLGLHTDFYTFAPETLAQQLPEFEILREVGKGSMGIVYEALRKSDGLRVALKVLPPSLTLTERALARFLREGELMSRIHHPSIVGVYDHGTQARLHYFVMEFVDGVSLEERLTVGPLPIRQVAAIGALAGRALQFAHDHGIVHRDIKPGNMILRRGDEERGDVLRSDPTRAQVTAPAADTPRIAITDFGLARETGTGSMTESGAIVGTPMFMAPEQILGDREAVGAQCDVYGLGATLYTLLTGRVPFGGPTAQNVLRQVLDDDPIRPRKLRRETPPEMEAVILKAMEKDPARRYGTATEMAEDLERFLRGERVLARLPGPHHVVGRIVRRHPLAASLVGVVLTLGFLVFVLQADRRARGLERALAQAENKLVRATLGRDETLRALSSDERRRLLFEAEMQASDVLVASPSFGRAWFVRAKARHRLGEWESALQDLDRYADRVGATPEVLTYRIDTLRHLRGDDSRTRLLADLNRLLSIDDGEASRYLVAEQLLDLVDDAPRTRRRELIESAERVLEGAPADTSAAFVLRARKYELQGLKELAIATMRNAVEAFQGDLSVHARAAELYRRQGLFEQSRAEAAIVRRGGGTASGPLAEASNRPRVASSPKLSGRGDRGGKAPIDLRALRSFLDEFEGVLERIDAPGSGGTPPAAEPTAGPTDRKP